MGFYHAPKSPLVLANLSNSDRAVHARGFTTAKVSLGEDEVLFGTAFCSVKDVFNKEKGRKIALTKALSHLNRDFRREIWQAYFDRFAEVHADVIA